jgi:hypothetical protein
LLLVAGFTFDMVRTLVEGPFGVLGNDRHGATIRRVPGLRGSETSGSLMNPTEKLFWADALGSTFEAAGASLGERREDLP